ncbi:hypothetical protein M433DRAFT_136983 [Acidomyces richmondensis BFW]|nr:MAG: hypothetical protein FE78DRAFT_68880 [Acidomyces sp. 'richmondensis']KYG42755.1 hypothetical protein M433DRAFT_136983 [Acidomyces richmondensis BFW]
MADILSRLEGEYCPPLDPALFSAIVLDYDLTSASHLQNARNTLDQLKECAEVEEAAGIEFPDLGAWDDDKSSQQPDSWSEIGGSRLRTDMTSDSCAPSSDYSEEDGDGTFGGPVGDVDSWTFTEKLEALDFFLHGDVPENKLRMFLETHGGNLEEAMAALLESGTFTEYVLKTSKGVDAFELGDDDEIRRSKKKKRNAVSRGRQLSRSGSQTGSQTGSPTWSSPTSPAPSAPASTGPNQNLARNRWAVIQEDVKFISSKMPCTSQEVHSMYHKCHASKARTVSALLDQLNARTKPTNKKLTADSPFVISLQLDFPRVKQDHLIAIAEFSDPGTTDAYELAEILNTPTPEVANEQILPQYIPMSTLSLENGEEIEQASCASLLSSAAHPRATDAPTDLNGRIRLAAALKAGRDALRNSTRHLGSNARTRGAIAANNHEFLRDAAIRMTMYRQEIADDLAASHSNEDYVDLHHMDVVNAKRIALAKAQEWWQKREEKRASGSLTAEERTKSFQIITGKGKNSPDGRPKLFPAVSAELERHGWKIEKGEGFILVLKKA